MGFDKLIDYWKIIVGENRYLGTILLRETVKNK